MKILKSWFRRLKSYLKSLRQRKFRSLLVEQFESRQVMAGINGIPLENVWLRADDNSLDTRAAANGTLVGDTNYVPGRFGSAFNFDGVGDSVSAASLTSVSSPTVSYTFWFRTSVTTGTPTLIGRQFADGKGWAVSLGTDGSLRLRIDTLTTANTVVSAGTGLRNGLWHFGSVTINDTTKQATIAVNGGTASTVTYAGAFSATGGFFSLAAPAIGSTSYSGAIDDVRVFNRVLTTAEISKVYSSPGSSTISSQTILEGAVVGPLACGIDDPNTATTSLIVTATSSNTTVVPSAGVVLGGTGGSRTVQVTPSTNAVGTSVISLTISDGVNSFLETFSVTTTPVNDPPTGANVTRTFLEDAVYTFAASNFTMTDALDSPANTLAAVVVTSLPSASHGTLALAGVPVTLNQVITVAQLPSLTFTPVANLKGTNLGAFTFRVRDNGGTANGGIDTDPVARTFAFTISSVNDAPVGTSFTRTFLEDAVHPFASAHFAITDPQDTPANSLLAVIIRSLPNPAHGVLTLSGVPVTVNQEVATTQLPSLVFTPATNLNGSNLGAFTFQVKDGGGVANGGVDTDPVTRTCAFNITAVNDPPVGTSVTKSINEDQTYAFVAGDFPISDSADVPANVLASVVITSLPNAAQGTLLLSTAAVTLNQVITVAQIPNLRFVPTANLSGSNLGQFTFKVRDNGSTASGGLNTDLLDRTFAFNIAAVNDAPLGSSATRTIDEDSFYTFAAGDFPVTDALDTPANTLSAVVITSLPSASHGTLNLSGVPVTLNQVVTLAQLPSLTFNPVANLNGTNLGSFIFRVRDNGGTLNGGIDTDATARTFAFNINAINDAPVGASITKTIIEDTVYTFVATDFAMTDPSDTPANTLSEVVVTSLPSASHGALRLSGVAVTLNQVITLAQIASLTFTPVANLSGTNLGTFNFRVRDNGGTASGGIDTDPTARTFAFNITGVNDAPVGASVTRTILEDSVYAFGAADFSITDPLDTPANTLSAIVIASLPNASHGTLNLSGVPVTLNQVVSLSQLPNLTFTPVANLNGTNRGSFNFNVQDNGGTTNGGVDTDAIARTFAFNITAVNDAPVGTSITRTFLEDAVHPFATAHFALTDPSDTPANSLSAVIITSLPNPAHGTLTLSGVPVTINQSVSAPQLPSLVFTPAANLNGTGLGAFTFRVRDGGGVLNGGVDTDPVERTCVFNITAVNDPPVGASATQNINEDQTYTFAASNFPITDASDVPANVLASVVITSLPSIAAGELRLSGAPVTVNQVVSVAQLPSLTFSPALNLNGTNLGSFTFKVRDNGGTAVGGLNTDLLDRTFAFNIAPVNDAPVGVSVTKTLSEDTTYAFSASDFPISDPLDVPANGLSGVTIVSRPSASHGVIRLAGAPISLNQTIALADLPNLVFTPTTNLNGPSLGSFTFRVVDNGGTANGGINTDPIAQTFSFDISPVNDPPTGTAVTRTILEDTTYAFATSDFPITDVLDTPANALAAIVISSLPSGSQGALTLAGVAVTVNQTVLATQLSSLTFTPAANLSGNNLGSFTFRVRDNGGTANGGSDTDPIARTFAFNITPVNDPPVGTSVMRTLNEDTTYTFAPSDFGISDPLDVPANSLSAVVITSLPNASHGTLSLAGVPVTVDQVVTVAEIPSLRFVPVADLNGNSLGAFLFRARDNGGTANGGSDTDLVAKTFSFNVTGVNDAPVGTTTTKSILEGATYTFSAADFGFTDPRDVPANAFSAVRIASLPAASHGVLRLAGATVTANQMISVGAIPQLTLAAGAGLVSGVVGAFTFQVQDNGGTANGGVDLDLTPRVFNFTPIPINSAPQGTSSTISILEDNSHGLAAADFGFSDPLDTPANSMMGVYIDSVPVASQGRLMRYLFGTSTPITAGTFLTMAELPSVRFVPAQDFNGNGVGQFSFRVRDNGGTANGGVDTDPISRTLQFNIVPVDEPPDGWNPGNPVDPDAETAAVVPPHGAFFWGIVPSIEPPIAQPTQGEEITYDGGHEILVAPNGFARASMAPNRRYQPHIGAVDFSLVDTDPSSYTLIVGGRTFTITDSWTWSVNVENPVLGTSNWSYDEYYHYTYTGTAAWTQADGTVYTAAISGSYVYDFHGTGPINLSTSSFHLLETRTDKSDFEWEFNGTSENPYGIETFHKDGVEGGQQNYQLNVTGNRTTTAGVVSKIEAYDYALSAYTKHDRYSFRTEPVRGGSRNTEVFDDELRQWTYNSLIHKPDIGGKKSTNETFTYVLDKDNDVDEIITSLYSYTDKVAGVATTTTVNKTETNNTHIAIDYTLQGTRAVDTKGVTSVTQNYDHRRERDDIIGLVSTPSKLIVDKSTPGAYARSLTTGIINSTTTTQHIRHGIASRQVNPSKSQFKLNYTTDMDMATKWITSAVNDLKAHDASTPGIVTDLTNYVTVAQSGLTTFDMGVKGSRSRNGSNHTSSATASSNTKTVGSGNDTSIGRTSSTGASSTANSSSTTSFTSNQSGTGMSMWTNTAWRTGTLVSGEWVTDNGSSYMTTESGTDKFDRKSNATSKERTFPTAGVVETKEQHLSEVSSGNGFFAGTASGMASRIAGAYTSSDVAVVNQQGTEKGASSSTTWVTRTDSRTTGKVVNSNGTAKLTSNWNSKSKGDYHLNATEIAGIRNRDEDTKVKENGVTTSVDTRSGFSNTQEIEPLRYSTADARDKSNRNSTTTWSVDSHDHKHFNTITGSKDTTSKIEVANSVYTLSGSLKQKSYTNDQTTAGLTAISKSTVDSSWTGNGTGSATDTKETKTQTNMAFYSRTTSAYSAKDNGTNKSKAINDNTVDGTQVLGTGHTRSTDSEAHYTENKAGVFTTTENTSSVIETIGTTTTKTESYSATSNEKGTLTGTRKDKAVVIEVDNPNPKYKMSSTTKSSSSSIYAGVYTLATEDLANLYADTTTDSSSQMWRTDKGGSKGKSDVKLTSSKSDARGATGFDVNYSGTAPQLFQGTVTTSSGMTHDKSKSFTKFASTDYASETNSRSNVRNSITESTSVEDTTESSTFELDSTVTKSQRSSSFTSVPYYSSLSTTVDTATLSRKGGGKSISHDTSFDRVVNGIRIATKSHDATGSGKHTKDDQNRSRMEVKNSTSKTPDMVTTSQSTATSTFTKNGTSKYKYAETSTYALFADATTEKFSASARDEEGKYNDKTVNTGTGNDTRKSTQDTYVSGVGTVKKFSEVKSYTTTSTIKNDNVGYKSHQDDSYQSWRNASFVSSSLDTYDEKGDRSEKSSSLSTVDFKDYGHTKSKIHQTQYSTNSIKNKSHGKFSSKTSAAVNDSTAGGRHSTESDRFKLNATVDYNKSKTTNIGDITDTTKLESIGMKTTSHYESTETSNGSGTSKVLYVSMVTDGVRSGSKSETTNINGNFGSTGKSKSVTTRIQSYDVTKENYTKYGVAPGTRFVFDWISTTTKNDTASGLFATVDRIFFTQVSNTQTEKDAFSSREETYATATNWVKVKGKTNDKIIEIKSGHTINESSITDNKTTITLSWTSRDTKHSNVKQNAGQTNSLAETSTFLDQTKVLTWNDSTKKNSNGDAKTQGHAVLTSKGHDKTTSIGTITYTDLSNWKTSSTNGAAPSKVGTSKTTAIGGGSGTWDDLDQNLISRTVSILQDTFTYDTKDAKTDKGNFSFSSNRSRTHSIDANGKHSYNKNVGYVISDRNGKTSETRTRSKSITTSDSGSSTNSVWTTTSTISHSVERGTKGKQGRHEKAMLTHDKNGAVIETLVADRRYNQEGTTRVEGRTTTVVRGTAYSYDSRTEYSKTVDGKSRAATRSRNEVVDMGVTTISDILADKLTTKHSSIFKVTDAYGKSKDTNSTKNVHEVTSTSTDNGQKYKYVVSKKLYVDDVSKGKFVRPDNIYEHTSYSMSGDFNSWNTTNKVRDFRVRTEERKTGSSKVNVTVDHVHFRDYNRVVVSKDSGTVVGSTSGSGSGSGYTGGSGSGSGGSWNNTWTLTERTFIDHHTLGKGYTDPSGGTGSGSGGTGGGGYPFNPYVGDFTGETFTGEFVPGVTITSFTGSTKVNYSKGFVQTWNDTGTFTGMHSTNSGSSSSVYGWKTNGTYSLESPTGQVRYTGTEGSFSNSNDNTSDAVDRLLQLNLHPYSPQFGSYNWDSVLYDGVRSISDAWLWVQDTASAFASELILAVFDPGGAYAYYEPIITDAVNSFLSSAAGFIDGFLDTINPVDYWWSIPNIGPIEGYEFSYTVGYVGGVVTGVGVQIAASFVSFGATSGACAASIIKLTLMAGKAFTVIDTVSSVASGIHKAYKLATSKDSMSGWGTAGAIVDIGLSFAPAIGAIGGKLGQKLNGADFMKIGGCFVAGTPVHLSAPIAASTVMELAQVGAALAVDEFIMGGSAASFPTPIDQVPLGARINSSNPRPWEIEYRFPELVEGDWRAVRAEVQRSDGTTIEVELLRPVAWLEQFGFALGREFPIEVEELQLSGSAKVLDIQPCPPISEGSGNLVTGRFVTRNAQNIAHVRLSDGTVLSGTDVHPVWSLDRGDWVALGELEVYESIQSEHGSLYVESVEFDRNPVDVFNIEVDVEHVYQVGDSGVLVHNANGTVCHSLARNDKRLLGFLVKAGGTATGNTPHHLIPVSLVNGKQLNTFFKKAQKDGWDINGLDNGLLLNNTTRHVNSHPRYNNYVKNRLLAEISSRGGVKSLKAGEAKQILDDLASEMKDFLKSTRGDVNLLFVWVYV